MIDGIGGHAAGEVAAAIAGDVILQRLTLVEIQYHLEAVTVRLKLMILKYFVQGQQQLLF